MSDSIVKRPTWAEINLDNLAFNFHSVKQFVGADLAVMAIVKADGYGHGAAACAKRLEAEGADWFGVALLEEALELRENRITMPILCLGGFWAGQEKHFLENDITPVIYQTETADSLDRAAREKNIIANVHVKVDTGMGRIGVRFDEVKEFADKLLEYKNLKIDGLMTHFATADNLSESEYTNEQINKFNESVKIFQFKGFNPTYKNLANSPGAVAHQNSHGNLIRIGGILYGLGGDVLPQGIIKPELKPVMSLHTRITHLKRVPKGETLGYSRTFTTEKDSLVATVPIGYEDGYRRSLSNNGHAIVNGIYVPVVGRISMDWTILDVSEAQDVKVNDEVVLIGESGELEVSAEELARQTNTISYEITCGINRRVIRKYVESE